MKIYTETTISFAKKLEKMVKDILSKEVNFEVKRTRFIYNNHSYPLHVVIIESKSYLGYFDPHTYQIGINIKLMYQAKDAVLRNILRHELAHYLTYIIYEDDDTAHGTNYKSICSQFGWSDDISKASMNINLANEKTGDLDSEKVIAKIKALLKLAESDNEHEAKLATLKANQLLLKHNIKNLEKNDSKLELYTDTLITGKKRNAKLTTIYDILKHFMVAPVFIYGKGQVAIEASGSRENLELAHYVAGFLDEELERLWKKQTDQKGMKAKNSFFLGLAKGYEQKILESKSEFTNEEKKSLIKAESNLNEKVSLVYRRLSSTRTQGSINSNAFKQGIGAGKNLNINKAIKRTGKTLLLNWRS